MIGFKDCMYRYVDGDLVRCANMKSPNDDFIDNACCGHGHDENAYISLKDGRRFILEKEFSE